MAKCVDIVGGYLVESADSYPNCTNYAIVTPEHLDRLTYWADLAIQLDPSQPDLYLIMTATLMCFVVALGWRLLARQLFNR